MLDKTYRPQEVEAHWYRVWETGGAFTAGQKPAAKPFTIVIPPPNVTGSLHVGHALNTTMQDVIVRFERMRGKDVLWLPGTDHAGIATQLVVERQMAERQEKKRQEIGRAAFVDKVWEWKKESGGLITTQLRRLGASCDWSRERFTMDEGLSRAVLKVFVTLYKQGLIYKDTRLVNWDPALQTAVSDLEVFSLETKGKLWHIKYPVHGQPDRYVTVATTRPETLLGDTAVAVHPDDERFKDLVGKELELPLAGRRIKMIADTHADPEKGSGAVKITPAHDFNDYEVGKRHGLEMIDIMTPDGRLNDLVPEAYRGLDRFVARDKIVADLEALGLLEKIEEINHAIPYDEKTKNVVLEPRLTEQWYADAAKLAKPAIKAVEEGATVFVPRNWEKVYFDWMRNIQPWCISRQLWWGHQIPAWYGPDGQVFVEETEAEAIAAAERHYGKAVALRRDEDVLDTWFSSALWPFSTLGWPEKTPDLTRFYKTDVLVTMFDIIFFWVARMMMMGLHFMGDVPFHTVLIHSRVVDESGKKMSKTKGNVINPLALIDEFGADALRFTLAMAMAQGRDVRVGPQRVEGYRNFITKLWNAARFCEMNGCARVDGFDPQGAKETLNRWIAGESWAAAQKVTEAIDTHRYSDAAHTLYDFIWGTFCDWYLELAKPLLNGSDAAAKAETQATAAWVLDQILVLLHPFCPFVTEELWARTGETGPARKSLLINAEWSDIGTAVRDQAAEDEIQWVIRLITAIRSVRSEMNVPASAQVPLMLKGASPANQARLARHRDLIVRLARLGAAEVGEAIPAGALQIVHDEALAILPVADFIDVAKEKARLAKDAEKAVAEIAKIDAKLNNPQFVAKAPEEVIEENRDRREEAERVRARIMEALERLSSG